MNKCKHEHIRNVSTILGDGYNVCTKCNKSLSWWGDHLYIGLRSQTAVYKDELWEYFCIDNVAFGEYIIHVGYKE